MKVLKRFDNSSKTAERSSVSTAHPNSRSINSNCRCATSSPDLLELSFTYPVQSFVSNSIQQIPLREACRKNRLLGQKSLPFSKSPMIQTALFRQQTSKSSAGIHVRRIHCSPAGYSAANASKAKLHSSKSEWAKAA